MASKSKKTKSQIENKGSSKTISVKNDFEDLAEQSYELDFKLANEFKIKYSDNTTIIINDSDLNALNDDKIECKIFNPDGNLIGINWPAIKKEEFGFKLYNWFMDLSIKGDNVYTLSITRGINFGGGFF